jgi:hypothetical protein
MSNLKSKISNLKIRIFYIGTDAQTGIHRRNFVVPVQV